MEIILDASAFLTWFALLIFGIIAITLYATWKHQTFAPIAFGVIISALIYYFRDNISPLVFGVLNYDWASNPVMFVLTGVFAVMFFAYIALVLWNFIDSGQAIQ